MDLARAVESALIEWRLDQAVAATFPCSDPIAMDGLAQRAAERGSEPAAETLALCAGLLVLAQANEARLTGS